MSLAIKIDILTGEYARQTAEISRPIAQAITGAMREAEVETKASMRQDAARAGFSPRWQKTLRSESYPKSKSTYSLTPSAVFRSVIPYAGVFEEGATLRGNPYMWAPLPRTPTKVGGVGSRRLTPEEYEKTIGDLVPMRSKSGSLLLGAQVRTTEGRATSGKISLSLLRRGAAGKRGKLFTIPLFVGIKSVDIRKRLNVTQLVQKAADSLASRYAANIVKVTSDGP